MYIFLVEIIIVLIGPILEYLLVVSNSRGLIPTLATSVAYIGEGP